MLQSFKMALRSIWGNKMRSFLTMLGIIIGVGAVIILVSIVNGYMSYMIESFTSMGVNRITVSYVAMPSRSIDVDEFYDFYMENSDLYQQMTPTVSVSARPSSSAAKNAALPMTPYLIASAIPSENSFSGSAERTAVSHSTSAGW